MCRSHRPSAGVDHANGVAGQRCAAIGDVARKDPGVARRDSVHPFLVILTVGRFSIAALR